MKYSGHYQQHDMIKLPAKSHIMVYELLKFEQWKIKVTQFIVLTLVYCNIFNQNEIKTNVQEGSQGVKHKTKLPGEELLFWAAYLSVCTQHDNIYHILQYTQDSSSWGSQSDSIAST